MPGLNAMYLVLFINAMSQWDGDDFSAAVDEARHLAPTRGITVAEFDATLKKLANYTQEHLNLNG